MNLANNHSLDFGSESLLETISYARSAGLQVVGAGANAAEAYTPAVVSTPGGTSTSAASYTVMVPLNVNKGGLLGRAW